MKNLESNFSIQRVIGGIFLIGGTAIGAGMLAQPLATAQGGFIPSLVVYFILYLFSTATGLLFLEICQWMPNDANIVTMSSHLLGKWGKGVSWILYIFLFYCLDIAYVAGGGGVVHSLLGSSISHTLSIVLFAVVFGGIVYFGTKAVDSANRVLVIGLVASFVAFIYVTSSKIEVGRLGSSDIGKAIFALPVVFTSFSYQGTIPTLYSYLKKNVTAVRIAIIIGSFLPFLIYVVWQFLILGVVPPEMLEQAKLMGATAIDPLNKLFPDSPIYIIGQFFGAFALTTSFLGVTIGLMDFLSDGLKIQKKGLGKGFLWLLVYFPPVLIASINPKIFFKALGYAGGIGCAVLLGFMPALMVYVGRYRKKLGMENKQLPGGKILLFCLMAFIVFELGVEFLSEIGVG